ncbi:MAG TPA: GNAT family N-acetyltransferase [Caulobacteraceae bacterium]|nr:GNAT family N-acetyltransferase [Caulobacteraceae bacterium]
MIETERLTLRRWVDADREPFVAIVTDPAVGEWLGGARTPAQAITDFNRMRAFWEEHGSGQLAIERKADAALVGRVGCRRQPPEWKHPMVGKVEIGWMLAPDAWGFGYATEAAAATLPLGFAAHDVAEIYSWTARINHRSEAVMRRIGMSRAPEYDFDHPDLPLGDPLRAHVGYVIGRQ